MVLNFVDTGMNVIAVVKINAVLGVVLASPMVHDKPPGDLVGKERPFQFFENGEREVYARTDTGTRINVIAFFKKYIGQNFRRWKLRLHFFNSSPMGGTFGISQQTGMAQSKCPVADGTDEYLIFSTVFQPVKKFPLRLKRQATDILVIHAGNKNIITFTK